MSGGMPPGAGAKRSPRSIDEERGVFMISVAAELAHMHPQTLRMYEARGLIEPQRSPKNTRLYSQRDVERLRRIQRMTSQQGLNLAGVETVLEMEERGREDAGRARPDAAPGGRLEQKPATRNGARRALSARGAAADCSSRSESASISAGGCMSLPTTLRLNRLP